MRLSSPFSHGCVEAEGDEAKRLMAAGFVPVPVELPVADPTVDEPPKKTTRTRKRKTATK